MPAGLRFFFTLFLLLLVTALHVGLSYLLPYPWSKINTLFLIFIMLLLKWDSGGIVWMVFFSHFLIELFAASPFGVILFSSVIAFLISFWFYRTIFTNRSWYAVMALTAFTLLIYRFIYLLIIGILAILKLVAFVPWRLLLITWFWEFITTTTALAVIYFVILRFSPQLKVSLVESFYYGGKK